MNIIFVPWEYSSWLYRIRPPTESPELWTAFLLTLTKDTGIEAGLGPVGPVKPVAPVNDAPVYPVAPVFPVAETKAPICSLIVHQVVAGKPPLLGAFIKFGPSGSAANSSLELWYNEVRGVIGHVTTSCSVPLTAGNPYAFYACQNANSIQTGAVWTDANDFVSFALISQ